MVGRLDNVFAQVGRGGDAWVRKEVSFSDFVSELSFESCSGGLSDCLPSLLDHTVGSTLTLRFFTSLLLLVVVVVF